MGHQRRYPIGAEVVPGQGTHFRVWAPARKRVEVVLDGPGEGHATALTADSDGYFAGLVAGAADGTRYRLRLDGKDAFPDPASRFQPEGPHGPSQVVDPAGFSWTDQAWKGIDPAEAVIYELHVGTFTQEGTWQAAARHLPELADTGVNLIEVMPLADFPGKFGWGYDGVNFFAPTRLYGRPEDFRAFVNAAHGLGLGVILDVVYNHFGPDGNYLTQFTPAYFTDRYDNEWGKAINYDGPDAGPVREFILTNAAYWIEEFHLDGLRLDATQQIFDLSKDHLLAALTRRVREAGMGRKTYLVGENECQHTILVRPQDRGGYGLDALWNDDFHHSAIVALTGRNEAYYTDYLGTPQEFVAAAKWGYLYQGQRYVWQKKRRGTPALDVGPGKFVTFLENHDQVANSGQGLRCHQLTSPGRYRALTALLLLGPGTPMLFQGQEFGASSPFFYFADHQPELAAKVAVGRRDFLKQFPCLALPESQARVADPADPKTFERCKLDHGERQRHATHTALHRDLLRLRREDPVFRKPRIRGVDGALLSPAAFVLRYFAEDGQDRLLVVNLGRDLHLAPAPEPLLAPPVETHWELAWTSEDVRYGGNGTPPPDGPEGWKIQGETAVVLVPRSGRPPDAPPPTRPKC